jgi:hypothetical protein
VPAAEHPSVISVAAKVQGIRGGSDQPTVKLPAGRVLRAARQGAKQSEFAATLSEELCIPISTTALSGWETGRRQVPAPVWNGRPQP